MILDFNKYEAWEYPFDSVKVDHELILNTVDKIAFRFVASSLKDVASSSKDDSPNIKWEVGADQIPEWDIDLQNCTLAPT